MIRLLAIYFAAFFSISCYAAGVEARPLKEVFSEADVILHGAVVGSGIGSCGGKEGINSFYIIRVTDVAKGGMKKGDIKACGSAPMLLSNQYLIAGNKYASNEIVFSSDGVLLVFPTNEYYRLISYDGPVVTSERGKAYATEILESDFLSRFGDTVKAKTR